MRTKTVAWAVVVALGLMNAHSAQSQGPYQGVGSEAPMALLVDLEGARRQLLERPGAWTLLKFGTTWCPRCAQEVEELNKLAIDLQKMGIRVVEVFLRETPQVVRAELKARPRVYRSLTLLDPSGLTIPAYGISVIPRLLLVDPNNIVRLDEQFLDGPRLKRSLSKTVPYR